MIGLLDRELGMPATGREHSSCSTGLRLVMADDDYADQQLMLQAVERAGVDASLTFLNDGSWLIRFLMGLESFELPDLMLLDLRMPRLDGFQVLDGLQSDPVLRRIPVLVLTAAEEPGDRQRAESSGAAHFDLKPRTFEELVDLARSFPRLVRDSTIDGGTCGDGPAIGFG